MSESQTLCPDQDQVLYDWIPTLNWATFVGWWTFAVTYSRLAYINRTILNCQEEQNFTIQNLHVFISNISMLFNWLYQKGYTLVAIPCSYKALGICNEGFYIRTLELISSMGLDVRNYIQSVKLSCSALHSELKAAPYLI